MKIELTENELDIILEALDNFAQERDSYLPGELDDEDEARGQQAEALHIRLVSNLKGAY